MRIVSSLMALVLVVSAATAAAQTLTFSQTSISTALPAGSGNVASDVVVGDFNSDGKQDVALLAGKPANGSFVGSQVIVLLGKGDGTFQSGKVSTAGIASRTLAVGDFNNDGKLDLVVANFVSSNISVLLGKGDGTFQPELDVTVESNSAWFVAVGDFNKDGKQDVAVALESQTSLGNDLLGVLLGNGDGTFKPMVTYRVGSNPRWVGVADLNGDGNLDLVTTNTHSADISVLLGNGDGTFQAQTTAAAGQRPGFGAIGDFDKDGHLDVAISASAQATVTVLLGKGDGTFPTSQTYTPAVIPDWITTADFDGDGNLDLAIDGTPTGTNNLQLQVLRGDGKGSFQQPIPFAAGSSANAGYPFTVAVADLNGDGKPDLVLANGSILATADMSVLLNTTTTSTVPAISGVVNGANFQPGIAASTWITIQGTNLSNTTRSWGSSDFVDNNLPVQLDGVSAKVNNIPAYVYYISPTQLNVLAPDDTTNGQVQVQVTNAHGSSTTFAANKADFSPAFFLFNAKYPAAVHTTGVYVGPVGLIAGANFAPAKPGETILLFGTGFGATNPALPAGKLVLQSARLANSATVTIGGKLATVAFAGLSGSGLDQLNVTIPADLPDGDAMIVATVGGVSTQSNLFIAVQH